MTDCWRAVRVESCANRDAVIAALFAAGSMGIHEDGDALVTQFNDNVENVLAAVMRADASAAITVTDAPAVDWSEWRANVAAHVVGDLVVSPPWLAAAHDPDRTIIIDPAMAFGTGEHATTRGMLRLMQHVIRPGDFVADLGAGSAVLSIAAVRLGAARVAAIEIDPDSEANAAQNIATNGVEDAVVYLVGDATVLLDLVAPVRVVVANIVSSVLNELLPSFGRALKDGGCAVLGGMLLEERAMMLVSFARAGWTVEEEDSEDEWWSAAITRAS